MSEFLTYLKDLEAQFEPKQYERILILQKEYPKLFDKWFNEMVIEDDSEFIEFLKNLKIMQVLTKVYEDNNDDFDELYSKIKKFFKKFKKEEHSTVHKPVPVSAFNPHWRNRKKEEEVVATRTLITSESHQPPPPPPPQMLFSPLPLVPLSIQVPDEVEEEEIKEIMLNYVPIIQQQESTTARKRSKSVPTPVNIRPDTPKHLRPRCASTSGIASNQSMTLKITDSEFDRLLLENKNINVGVDVRSREIYRKTTITPCSTPLTSIPFRKQPSVVERSHTPSDGRYGCKLCKQLHQRKSYDTGSVTCTKQGTGLQVILSFLRDYDLAPLENDVTWRSSRIEEFKCIKVYERFFSIILPTYNDIEWERTLRKRAFETRFNRWVSVAGTSAQLVERGELEEYLDPVLRDRPQVKRRREMKQEAVELGINVETRGKKKKKVNGNESEESDDEMNGLLS